MAIEAKIAALKGAAERKRQDALERTNQAITKLVKEGKKITFAAVAEAAKVSVAYLYKYDALKERIDHLKAQQEKISKSAQPQPASDKSKQVIITQLRERIKKLEAENRGLREQNEAIYGRFCQLQGVQQQVEALKAQNASLKVEKEQQQQAERSSASNHNAIPSAATPNTKVTFLARKRSERFEITASIQTALADVGLKLNPTLAKAIQSVPEVIVLTAIDALKEAMTAGGIERPGGWLKRAIEECWEPNESEHQQVEAKLDNSFSQWFDLAKAKGLVVASMLGEDGQIHVFDKEGTRYPFEKLAASYPLKELM